MTFEEYRDGDRTYRELAKKSTEASIRALNAPIGSTAARNARIAWSRAAEARDYHEMALRKTFDERSGRAG